MAECFFLNGQTEEAKKIWQEILSHEPLNHDACIGMAEYLLDKGKYKEAETVLTPIVARHDKSAEAAFFLGCSYFEQKRYFEAAMFLRRANEHDPDNYFVLSKLSECYLLQGRFQDAEEILAQIADDIEDVAVQYNYAVALLNIGDISGAKKRVELVLNSNSEQADQCRSIAHYTMGKCMASEAIDREENDQALLAREIGLKAIGHLLNSLRDSEEASWEAHYFLAQMYIINRRFDKAKIHAEYYFFLANEHNMPNAIKDAEEVIKFVDAALSNISFSHDNGRPRHDPTLPH